ncbi:MAG: outer membrane protein assembly factor [Prevotellaceae bacterium]|nr:outer membrane protein assembly factor [Prevotellaceae bacterium]
MFEQVSDSLLIDTALIDTALVDTTLIDSVLQKKKNIVFSFIKAIFTGELDWNFIATPLVNYQPETNWGFGAAGAYYIKPKKTDGRVGTLGFNVSYTLNKQFNVNVLSTIYLDKKQKWFLYSNVSFRHFYDVFYGIGNRKNQLLTQPFSYNSDNFHLILQPQTIVKGHWLAGLNFAMRWENASAGVDNELGKNTMFEQKTRGFEKYFMLGLGGIISYDSRNEMFYPRKGQFFKSVLTSYKPIFGSSYQMIKLQIDFRQYFTIYNNFIFAWQFLTEWNLADDPPPFQMLATIGGMEFIRGVRSKMWNDDVMAGIQAEFRIPIWRIFKAAVFAGIGDVYNLRHWQFTTPKIGYGFGLRVRINKSNANLRFDIARNNYDKNFRNIKSYNFYITVNEAF